MKVVITGGGTGGHIYPALAILDGLKQRYSDLEVIYIGTDNRMESKMIPELGIEYVGLTMQGVNRKNIFKNFKLIFLLIKNFLILRKIYKKNNIDVVIGTGGYVTVPVIYTASKMKIPTLIFDADVNFGMATKRLMKHADVVCSGFENPSKVYSNVVYTGNPRAQKIYESVKRENIKNKVLFIFGSLGSETLNQFFVDYFNNNEIDYNAKYVTGHGMYEQYVIENNNINVDDVEYIDDITSELSDVAFVVARSGATFVSELEALAIPAIYIPSPNVANDEQVKNIKTLVDNDLAYMIEEKDLSSENFEKCAELIKKRSDEMVNKLKKVRKIDALEMIVEKVGDLVNGKN